MKKEIVIPKNGIPKIVHPLGKYWDQPDLSEIEVYANCALMTKTTFRKLQFYDCSYPTGRYEGKMWGRTERKGGIVRHYLVWYGIDPEPGHVTLSYRKIFFI
jgi:hypothetical protein